MKTKVGVVCICLNPPYWSFINEMLWGLDTFFLKRVDIRDKYETEFMVWSDIPENSQLIKQKIAEYLLQRGEVKASLINQDSMEVLLDDLKKKDVNNLAHQLINIKQQIKVFEIDPMDWPMPTLMRYHLFLHQEEYLQKFDYIFYIDVDMRITDWIGEEILGDGLTAAQHPMYALRQNLHLPCEPNPESTAYIKLPGRLLIENGNKRFEPLYYAGGFQGGKTKDFIKAMKVMRAKIDEDFNRNYIARWNDESHWNKYLFDVPPTIVLDPSYIYPDSLIAEYYVRQVWGRNYSPKIVTLTKAFSANAEGGMAVQKLLAI